MSTGYKSKRQNVFKALIQKIRQPDYRLESAETTIMNSLKKLSITNEEELDAIILRGEIMLALNRYIPYTVDAAEEEPDGESLANLFDNEDY